jgi:hypothetical protein
MAGLVDATKLHIILITKLHYVRVLHLESHLLSLPVVTHQFQAHICLPRKLILRKLVLDEGVKELQGLIVEKGGAEDQRVDGGGEGVEGLPGIELQLAVE